MGLNWELAYLETGIENGFLFGKDRFRCRVRRDKRVRQEGYERSAPWVRIIWDPNTHSQ
ncbi:hypothetical protein Hanom_Chr09g00869731 [Helianthus anomalus]